MHENIDWVFKYLPISSTNKSYGVVNFTVYNTIKNCHSTPYKSGDVSISISAHLSSADVDLRYKTNY